MTIFGVRWENLRLTDVGRFLADAEAEPLLWEAKGIEARPGEVRRQVCGFANSHDGGYLIIGAAEGDSASWTLDGVEFNDEPPIWVANVVGNGSINPYPDGLDTRSWPTSDSRHVAVVQVPPTPTPPCNANGTVFERVSGRTIAVREPLRLAQLFARGDQARKDAHAKADAAARRMLREGLASRRYDPTVIQFGLGLAAAGYDADISARLFSQPFDDRVFRSIEQLDHGPMFPAGGPRPESTVTQDARQFVSEGQSDRLGQSWIVRATWSGAVGIYWTPSISGDRLDSIVEHPVAAAWEAAEHLLLGLGGQGSRYLQLAVAGGPFRPNPTPPTPTLTGAEVPPTVVGRGPLSPGVIRPVLSSIERELRRATGEMAYEQPPGGDTGTG